jgi:hypothetical protein
MMTGVDLAGLADGARRQVFILDIREAVAEAERMGVMLEHMAQANPRRPRPAEAAARLASVRE